MDGPIPCSVQSSSRTGRLDLCQIMTHKDGQAVLTGIHDIWDGSSRSRKHVVDGCHLLFQYTENTVDDERKVPGPVLERERENYLSSVRDRSLHPLNTHHFG